MKLISELVFVGVFVAGGGPQAAGFELSPQNVKYSWHGSVNIGTTYVCKLSIRGEINKQGVGKISSAKFKPGDATCVDITAGGLPWVVKAVSSDEANVFNATINTPSGACSGEAAPFVITKSGGWKINTAFPPPCDPVVANIKPTPRIFIVP